MILHHAAPPVIYTLSLHDALPIFFWKILFQVIDPCLKIWLFGDLFSNFKTLFPLDNDGCIAVRKNDHFDYLRKRTHMINIADRKSTRLNSSHVRTSYAVFRVKNKT